MNSGDLLRTVDATLKEAVELDPLPEGVKVYVETFNDKVRVHVIDERDCGDDGEEGTRAFAVAPFIDIALTTANELGVTDKLVALVQDLVGKLLTSVLTPKTTPPATGS